MPYQGKPHDYKDLVSPGREGVPSKINSPTGHVVVTPDPEGRSWTKCCGVCATRHAIKDQPQEAGEPWRGDRVRDMGDYITAKGNCGYDDACRAVVEGSVPFACQHQTDPDGRFRTCAGWAAIHRRDSMFARSREMEKAAAAVDEEREL